VNFTQFGTSAISPDGRKIVFAAYGNDGIPRLWLRPLDAAVATPLQEATINQQTVALFWSPDSRFVAYGDGKQLLKIDVTGGAPQALASIVLPLGGSWSSDGTILIGSTSGIQKLSANGGTMTLMTKPASPKESHAHPVFLPDGRHFLYLRGLPPGQRTIQVGDVNAAPDAQSTTPTLTTDYGVSVQATAGDAPRILFLRDGTLLEQAFDMSSLTLTGSPVTVMEQVASVPNGAFGQFSVSNTGTLMFRAISGINRQLTWYDRRGDVIGRPGEPAPFGTMKVSPDGSKAAVVQNEGRGNNPDIWIVDLVNGSSTRFTFDPNYDAQPVWSPDGRYIAWMGIRNNQLGLYRKAADGSGSEELLGAPKDFTNLTDWTHNGYLIFVINGDEYAMPVDADAAGNRTPVAVVETPNNNERGAYVSPDNRWIAYLSSETGREEIYVQPFSAGGNKASGKWMVSKGTRGMARWRSDSKELIFLDGEGEVVSVDVAAGPVFQTSPPTKLFQMPLELLSTASPGTLADATRDVQRFLLVMPVQESAQRELAVVLNWQDGVKR
jgi:Tol biopolymer transport system component